MTFFDIESEVRQAREVGADVQISTWRQEFLDAPGVMLRISWTVGNEKISIQEFIYDRELFDAYHDVRSEAWRRMWISIQTDVIISKTRQKIG